MAIIREDEVGHLIDFNNMLDGGVNRNGRYGTKDEIIKDIIRQRWAKAITAWNYDHETEVEIKGQRYKVFADEFSNSKVFELRQILQRLTREIESKVADDKEFRKIFYKTKSTPTEISDTESSLWPSESNGKSVSSIPALDSDDEFLPPITVKEDHFDPAITQTAPTPRDLPVQPRSLNPRSASSPAGVPIPLTEEEPRPFEMVVTVAATPRPEGLIGVGVGEPQGPEISVTDEPQQLHPEVLPTSVSSGNTAPAGLRAEILKTHLLQELTVNHSSDNQGISINATAAEVSKEPIIMAAHAVAASLKNTGHPEPKAKITLRDGSDQILFFVMKLAQAQGLEVEFKGEAEKRKDFLNNPDNTQHFQTKLDRAFDVGTGKTLQNSFNNIYMASGNEQAKKEFFAKFEPAKTYDNMIENVNSFGLFDALHHHSLEQPGRKAEFGDFMHYKSGYQIGQMPLALGAPPVRPALEAPPVGQQIAANPAAREITSGSDSVIPPHAGEVIQRRAATEPRPATAPNRVVRAATEPKDRNNSRASGAKVDVERDSQNRRGGPER